MKVWELFAPGIGTWTRGVPARDGAGNRVEARDPSAVCWDLLGAIAKCYPPAAAHDVEMKLRHHIFANREGKLKLGDCLSLWNDRSSRTYADVFQLVRSLNV